MGVGYVVFRLSRAIFVRLQREYRRAYTYVTQRYHRYTLRLL